MENRKFVIIISLFLIVFLAPLFASAYGVQTHAGITKEIFKTYDKLYGSIFTDKQVNKAIQGSIDEDNSIRFLNHFYDPINNKGLDDFFKGESSKYWAQDTERQANFIRKKIWNSDKYFSSPTDFSWDRAVFEYVYGDKNRAIETLGHILHLIEDATVPAHVRNDQHLIGDSYEKFTSKFDRNTISDFNIEESEIPALPGIAFYFDNVSVFTNKNFLSDDRIFKNYDLPSRDDLKVSINDRYKFLYKIIDNNKVRIAYIKYTDNVKWRNYINIENKEIYKLNDPNNLVLTDYWNTLSRVAVINGVGVIKLFFEDVKKEKQTLALKEKNKSKAERILAKIIPAGFNIVKNLYGSSLTDDNLKELTGNDQAGAVVLSVDENNEIDTKTEPNSIDAHNDTEEERNTQLFQNMPPEEDPIPQIPDDASEEYEEEETIKINTEEERKGDTNNTEQKMYPVPIIGAGGGGSSSKRKEENNIEANTETKDTTPPAAPSITSPSDFSQIFTATDILFKGTAPAASAISTDFSNATTSADSNGDWMLPISGFSQGTTTVKFFATDEYGNTSPATSASFFIDSEAPDVSLNVSECEQSLSKSECIVSSTKLSISWKSTASDLSHFSLNINGTASTTNATSTSITVNESSEYSFGVSAVDIYGNASATSTQKITIETIPIAINEVAWAGTKASPADEWIELYNNTNTEISLDGWSLRAEDGSPYIPLAGSISPNDYFLIERTDDDTVSDISADLIVPFGGTTGSSGLSNSGEHLILARFDGTSTTTIDEINKCNKWCFNGDTNKKHTMERYDPAAPGTDWSNWGSNIDIIRNGKDKNGTDINGTPKQKNSFSYLVNKGNEIDGSVTLQKEKSPYVITKQNFKIWPGGVLNIEPGVVIKFKNDAGIIADGNIVAEGSESDPIVFTSFADDSYGGDTNGDGLCDPDNVSETATCPQEGMWFGVELSGASTSSSFDHTVFRYGGKWYNGQQQKRANLYINGASPKISNSVFEYSKRYGLYLSNASSNVSNSIFRNNNYSSGKDRSSCGLYGVGGAPSVQDNVFENNIQGLCFSSSDANIKGNVFTGNTYRAFTYAGASGGSISGNSGTSNAQNGIIIYGLIAGDNSTTTLQKNNMPYLINTSDIEVSASSTLIISPGVVLKFKDRRMNIFGNLRVNGESGNKVLFTSIYDDSDGNDALNDGESLGRINGDQGVYMKDGSSSIISNAEFKFMKKALVYENSPINLSDVSFSGNDYSIYATGASTTVYRADDVVFVGDTNTSTSTIPLIVP